MAVLQVVLEFLFTAKCFNGRTVTGATISRINQGVLAERADAYRSLSLVRIVIVIGFVAAIAKILNPLNRRGFVVMQ